MLGLLLGAGVLGIIIAVMDDGEFPGWFPLIGCVLAAIVPAAIINAFLPPSLFIVGLAVGAIAAGCAISAMCGMSVQRSSIAASIFLAVQTGLSFLMASMT